MISIYADEGDDAPYWSGEVTPEWTAPYDSDECGHYCYVADATIELLPGGGWLITGIRRPLG